jgi:hypothetical protein
MFQTGTATDYRDLLEQLHTFLTSQGSAFGLTFEGTGTGRLTAYRGGASSVAETWTIECWDADTPGAEGWTVTGSVTGLLGTGATTGVAYSDSHIAFTITAGGTAFAVGDKFILNTAPPWATKRRVRGAILTASSGNSGQYAKENVLDGKLAYTSNRYWSAGAAPQTLQFDFPEAVTVAEYAIMAASTSGYAPSAWTFEYWNGSAWVVLDTRSSQTSWSAGQVRSYAVASPVSATRYRLNISAGNSSSYLYIDAVHLRAAVAGVDQAMSQYIWAAPGNDGQSEILVGAHTFQRSDVDYFDWELCAFDGYEASLPFYGQAGCHGQLYLPLLNSSIPYWFVANGRRAIVIAKVGTQYESAYLGFLEPYFTPQQLPYPIALGGSLALGSTQPTWESASYRYSNATNQHRAFTHSDCMGNGSSSTLSAYYAQARARSVSGGWVGHWARSSDGLMSSSQKSYNGLLWPLCEGMTNLDVCADGSYALFPVLLSYTTPNHWGQFEGVSVLTGQDLSAESLIRVGAVDHLAVPNITRVDRDDFLAVRLD